jgi:hypothetical protein
MTRSAGILRATGRREGAHRPWRWVGIAMILAVAMLPVAGWAQSDDPPAPKPARPALAKPDRDLASSRAHDRDSDGVDEPEFRLNDDTRRSGHALSTGLSLNEPGASIPDGAPSAPGSRPLFEPGSSSLAQRPDPWAPPPVKH